LAKNIFDNAGNLYNYEILRDRFFIDTVKDLFDRVNDPTDYNIIRASGLIRQLIKESAGQPLVHKVTKDLSHKLIFKVNSSLLDTNLLINNEYGILQYNPLQKQNGFEEINLKKFLQRKCIYLKDKINEIELEVSVKDIINLLSHSHGGIHYEETGQISLLKKSSIKDMKRFEVLFGSVGIFEANFDCDVYKVALNIYKVVLNALQAIVIKINRKMHTNKAKGIVSKSIVKIEQKKVTKNA